jgi:rhamnose transport system permease protein
MQRLMKNREILLGAIIVVLIGAFSTRADNFAAPSNLATIFNDTSILIILALGQMTVILTKSIDLSVAANLAFTGMAVAMLDAAYPGLPLAVLIVLSVLIGAGLGAINGFLVWLLQIPDRKSVV